LIPRFDKTITEKFNLGKVVAYATPTPTRCWNQRPPKLSWAEPAGNDRLSPDDRVSKRRGLFPKEAPAAAAGYSPGIQAEGRQLVFVSGQGPKDLGADMEQQIRQTFEQLGAVLRAGGASFKDVVMLRAYFVHLEHDLSVYRKVRKEYLVEPYPASTAVGVSELAITGLQVENEGVAVGSGDRHNSF
jgi:enamine deaminase RidA (YjgF/YER057c/UK114 family)